MRQPQTIVIGGGVAGVCTAYALARRGQPVTLLERGEICSGASHGNAGLLLPSHCVPLAAPGVLGSGLRWLLDPASPFYIRPRLDPALISWLLRFAAACRGSRAHAAMPVVRDLHRASLALYEQIVAERGLRCGFARHGMLMLFRTRAGLAAGIREARLVAERGVAAEPLDEAAVREKVPCARPGVVGGVFYPEDAQVTPGEFVRALAGVAAQLGARVLTHTEVIGFETAGRSLSRVRTTRGDFEAGDVVLAAGSWSPVVARELGLRVPVQPAKGYSVTIRRPESCPALPLLLNEARVGVTPMGDTLRFAGTLELAGLDLSISRRRLDAIVAGARAYLDGLDQLEVLEIWRGLRPCTPDGLPLIGRARAWDNLTFATGHAMIGISLGPITGELVAQLLCGEPPSLEMGPVSPARFGL